MFSLQHSHCFVSSYKTRSFDYSGLIITLSSSLIICMNRYSFIVIVIALLFNIRSLTLSSSLSLLFDTHSYTLSSSLSLLFNTRSYTLSSSFPCYSTLVHIQFHHHFLVIRYSFIYIVIIISLLFDPRSYTLSSSFPCYSILVHIHCHHHFLVIRSSFIYIVIIISFLFSYSITIKKLCLPSLLFFIIIIIIIVSITTVVSFTPGITHWCLEPIIPTFQEFYRFLLTSV